MTWYVPICITLYHSSSAHRVHLSVHRALLSVHRALLSVHRALLSAHRVHLSAHRVHLSVHRALLSVQRALLSVYRALLSVCRAHDVVRAYLYWRFLQGGEDPQDTLSCRSFFAKEPLIIGLFCGN